MFDKKFYYIFDSNVKYITTCNIEELAKFLNVSVRKVKYNMTINKRRKYCILKNDKGEEFRVENEKQFFGSNLKEVKRKKVK